MGLVAGRAPGVVAAVVAPKEREEVVAFLGAWEACLDPSVVVVACQFAASGQGAAAGGAC